MIFLNPFSYAFKLFPYWLKVTQEHRHFTNCLTRKWNKVETWIRKRTILNNRRKIYNIWLKKCNRAKLKKLKKSAKEKIANTLNNSVKNKRYKTMTIETTRMKCNKLANYNDNLSLLTQILINKTDKIA